MTSSDATPGRGDALIIVDVQNDFLPGGKLGVPTGNEILPALNRYIDTFRERGLPVYATRDWHPKGHCSFEEQGGPWPEHCVQDTEGARFSPDLALPPETVIVSKGVAFDRDQYSGFDGTGLGARLREEGIERVFIGGLATEVCVLSTVRDARKEGFEVFLLTDGSRAIDINPGDGEKAIAEMKEHGARTIEHGHLAA